MITPATQIGTNQGLKLKKAASRRRTDRKRADATSDDLKLFSALLIYLS